MRLSDFSCAAAVVWTAWASDGTARIAADSTVSVGDQPRARRVECLRAVAHPAGDEGEPEHENAVGDHGTHERRLNDER